MESTRKFIVLAALALAFGQPAASGLSRANLERIERVCHKIIRGMYGLHELQTDGQKALNFTRDWLERKGEFFNGERKILPAWEAVSQGKECSASSWQNVLVLTRCLANLDFDVLREPLRVYTNKCLTPDYVSKKVNSETRGLFTSSVGFISSDFIQKYHQDNPGERPLHVNPIDDVAKRTMENCCRPDKSYGAVVSAIERAFAKKRDSPTKKFHGNIDELKSYLSRKLFMPCEGYLEKLQKFKLEIQLASKHFVGGEEALIASLDQEAQSALFRLKYCDQLPFLKGNLVFNVAHRI